MQKYHKTCLNLNGAAAAGSLVTGATAMGGDKNSIGVGSQHVTVIFSDIVRGFNLNSSSSITKTGHTFAFASSSFLSSCARDGPNPNRLEV